MSTKGWTFHLRSYHKLINESETSLSEHGYGTNVIYLMSEAVLHDRKKSNICYVLTSS
jgi:hypothetical protein